VNVEILGYCGSIVGLVTKAKSCELDFKLWTSFSHISLFNILLWDLLIHWTVNMFTRQNNLRTGITFLWGLQPCGATIKQEPIHRKYVQNSWLKSEHKIFTFTNTTLKPQLHTLWRFLFLTVRLTGHAMGIK